MDECEGITITDTLSHEELEHDTQEHIDPYHVVAWIMRTE